MTQFIFELIFEFGAFPGIVLYLLYTIIKERKQELKKMQEAIEQQNKSIRDVVLVLEKIQNTMSNQMHDLLIKFIEVSSKNGGGKQ